MLEAVRDLNDWKRLGLALGLCYHTIKHIETDRKEKPDDCKMDMLAAWLKQQDNVSRKGVPSWLVLKTTLKRMGENALAEKMVSCKYIILMVCIVNKLSLMNTGGLGKGGAGRE